MRKPYSLIFTLLLFSFLYSCQNQKEKQSHETRHPSREGVLNFSLLFGEHEKEVSFPIWFNDSVLAARKIQQIERNLFPRISEETESSVQLPLKEKIIYGFDKKGKVKTLIHDFYVDLHSATRYKFVYSGHKSEKGFAKVKVQKKNSYSDNYTPIAYAKNRFSTYKIKKETDQYTVYQSQDDIKRIIVIEDTNLWNVLTVDRLFKPKLNDQIVLGQMQYPLKIYSVENKIKESNVFNYTYQDESLRSIEHLHYPFLQKRNFTYDQEGHCLQFTDSNFVDNTLLYITRHTILRDSTGLPLTILHEKKNILGGISYQNKETFTYQFSK